MPKLSEGRFHCPDCAVALDATLSCPSCTTSYPKLAGVPFLFPKPQLELARWQARAHAEQQNLRDQQHRCEHALKASSDAANSEANPSETKARLRHLAGAYREQIDCLETLLAPLLDGQQGSDHATYKALQTGGLADSTTLFSYASNLFRDWVWGQDENSQALAMMTMAARGPLGKTLVLGSGGGRLAFDLATTTTLAATDVTAVDINPFTTLAAQQITQTKTPLRLWEFPLAPICVADTAIEHHLQIAKGARPANLQMVLADARALPYADESFDTVVTPWFTDVVQDAPASTAQRINRLLKTGGQWLNFGSVAFANADPAKCLLLPELLAIASANGFGTPSVVEERGPYLCSPRSRYGRTELLHAFAAEKKENAKTTNTTRTSHQEQTWITNPRQSVPVLEIYKEQAMATQIHAYLLSLIDGERSISDIAQILEERRLMTAREAVPVVQRFLVKMAE